MPDASADHRLAWRVLPLLLAGLLLMLGWWASRALWVDLPDASTARLPCLSYAPFRRAGHTPFDPDLRLSRAQITDDLRRVQALTNCVRTYGIDHGLDAVPSVARELGLQVVLGAWLGRDELANAQQVARAAELAREYRDVVRLLMVGNEVLLRRELPPAALARWLNDARRISGVPVGYADVWEFWQRHVALAESVDVVAVHILPYWEDDPVAVDQAVDHVWSTFQRMRETFAPRPVWLAETGWPSFGRHREGAWPGRVEQARFVRSMTVRAEENGLDFNLIEAFDQPWKRALEGAMGGHWGIFDADGQQRVPLQGPVREDAHWAFGLWAALAGSIVGLAIALWARSAPNGPWRLGRWAALDALRQPAVGAGLATLVMLGAWLGMAIATRWITLLPWPRNAFEWTIAGVELAILALAGLTAAWRLTQTVVAGAAIPAPGLWSAWRSPSPWSVRAQAVIRLVALFVVAAQALTLLFDDRYRELPWALWLLPALPFAALACAGERTPTDAREERLLGVLLGLFALSLVALQGLHNAQALACASALALLAMATLWPHRDPLPQAKPANNNAGAADPAL